MSECTFDESSMTPSSFSLARILPQSFSAFCNATSVPAATVKPDVDATRTDSRAPDCSLAETEVVGIPLAFTCAPRIALSNFASKRMDSGTDVADCETFPVQSVADSERKGASDTT